MLGFEWGNSVGAKTPHSFNSIIILFEDGEYMLQSSDSVIPDELEQNKNVFLYTYLNEENRVDVLHMALLYTVFKDNDKAKASFVEFRFTIDDFMSLYKELGLVYRVEKNVTDEVPEKIFTVDVPISDKINAVKFAQDAIAPASCLILKLIYGNNKGFHFPDLEN